MASPTSDLIPFLTKQSWLRPLSKSTLVSACCLEPTHSAKGVFPTFLYFCPYECHGAYKAKNSGYNRQKLFKLRMWNCPVFLFRMPLVAFDAFNFCDVIRIIRKSAFYPFSIFPDLYHFLCSHTNLVFSIKR
jgi:hypothetical protein